MRIALIFNKENEATTGCYFEREFKKTSFDISHFWTKDSDKIKSVYDLYIRIDHGDYKYDIPDYLHPAIFYAIDAHLKKPYKKIREQARHYDLVFCAHKDGADRLKKDKVADAVWLPVACAPAIHKKLTIQKRFDLGFVGTEGKKSKRKALLDFIKKKYPDSFIGRTEYTKISEIYSASKIGFNYSINNDINMRMFEIMSCGTMLLTNAIKRNGFEDLFKNGIHLVTYKTKRELKRFIDYYLTNEEEREKIALAGYEHVINNHTYLYRLNFMLSVIKERLSKKYNLPF
ncbi:MAG: glycosyltransferase [Candidatus Omnitrophica bacterium]|nr:glycosyltransferase [Candidatus Omnitrophota bacterium]